MPATYAGVPAAGVQCQLQIPTTRTVPATGAILRATYAGVPATGAAV